MREFTANLRDQISNLRAANRAELPDPISARLSRLLDEQNRLTTTLTEGTLATAATREMIAELEKSLARQRSIQSDLKTELLAVAAEIKVIRDRSIMDED